MSKKKIKVHYTIDGLRAFYSYIQGPLKRDPGFVYGLGGIETDGSHLTVVFKDDTMYRHIKTKVNGQEIRHNLPPISIHELGEKSLQRFMRFIKKIHGNTRIYIPQNDLKTKLEELFSSIDVSEGLARSKEFPMEYYYIEIELDLDNDERWKKIRVNQLKDNNETISIWMDGNIPRIVMPLDDGPYYICFSNRQLKSFERWYMDTMGYSQYYHIIMTDYDKESM
jgi:hypothetical protein